MLLRELKVNRKSFILWTLVVILIFLVVFLVYPSIIESNGLKDIDKIMNIFPKEILAAFNMDIVSISSVFGWIKTEGITFFILLGSIYSAILASNIMVKEESDKTIEFLVTKPVSRNRIINTKIVAGLINIIFFTVIVTVFNLLGLYFSDDLHLKSFLLLNLSPVLIFCAVFFVTLTISAFFRKTKQTIGLGIGIVFMSYFLQILGNLSDKVSFLKYFSMFELAPSRSIIQNNSITLSSVMLTLLIIAVCYVLVNIIYKRKEFTV